MGPKTEAVIHPNVPTKELSWIDRMYQKLEDICVEVDRNPSLLIQETSKYMENQMNVVGTNVKKICAELIQDLLPPTEKKFDCPIHCKCDCIDSEKPKQKGSYPISKDTKWGSEDIDAQEANIQHNNNAAKVGDKMEDVTTKQRGMDGTEFNNHTSVKLEKQDTAIECGAIKSKETNLTQVMIQTKEMPAEGFIDSDEKKVCIGGLQESENNAIFVDQVSTPKQCGKQDGIRKDEHNGSYKSHCRTVNKKRLVKKRITTTSKEEPEMSTAKFEGTFLDNMNAIKEKAGGIWCQDGSKMPQDGLKNADDLQNNLNTCTGNNIHNSDVCHGRDKDLSLNEMNDDVDVTSSSTESKSVGNEADDLIVTCDRFSTELCGTSKGQDSMMVSGFLVEVDSGDEEQSARWLVSESHINIFQHDDNSFPFSFNKLSTKKDDRAEEFESDWELL